MRKKLLLVMLLLAGCASSDDRRSGSLLIDDRSIRPAAGTRGWNFEQSWAVDLDGDPDRERVVLLAQVEKSGDRLLWEDAHRWVAYVEEPAGDRTYFFSRLVPRGRVELFSTTAEGSESPRIVLLQRGGLSVGMWEVRYRGRDNVEVRALGEYPVDASTFVGGTRE
jgi:hypothetical protein